MVGARAKTSITRVVTAKETFFKFTAVNVCEKGKY